MVNEVNRTLVDKEKVEVNGKLHYRLYFFDNMTGAIAKVLCPVAEEDVVIKVPEPVTEEVEEVTNIDEFKEVLDRE